MALCLVLGLLITPAAEATPMPPSVKAYAHGLVIARWHSEAEWVALDAIVRPESTWNPCRYYPSSTDCRYRGANSCGIPQANPCPAAWRGRLRETRYAQARWIVDYVARRYGSPSRALAFRRSNGWY